MKRKLLSLVLGTVMIMSSGITAMAAEAPVSDSIPAMAVTVSLNSADGANSADFKSVIKGEVVNTVNSTMTELKDGLYVSQFPAFDENTSSEKNVTGYAGVVSKEDMKEIISSLNLNDEKATALMSDFEKNMKLQDERNSLFEGITADTDEKEIQKIFDQDAALYEDMIEIFTGDILDKAVELGLLEKVEACIATSVSMASLE